MVNSYKVFLLMKAISIIESSGNPEAIGDNGRALGHLQIHACVVNDVNRVYKLNLRHSDMLQEEQANRVFWLWLNHYGKALSVKLKRKLTPEDCARLWNCGLNGYSRDRAKGDRYWAKVQPVYEAFLIQHKSN